MKIYPLFDDVISNDFDLIEFYKNLFSDTYQLYKNEEYYEILKIIDKDLSENFHNALMWAYKGYILYKLSYIDDALRCVDISLNIDDLIDFAWLLKSMILKRNDKLDESLICYKEFVVLKYDADINMTHTPIKRIIDIEVNPNPKYDFKGQFDNVFNSKEELFSLVNIENFKINQITTYQYNTLINNIIDTAREIFTETIKNNFINFNSLLILDKVILISKSFVDVSYKSEGEELGEYSLNSIVIDDRLFNAQRITTLLHELSHHLLAEIFEQYLMVKLNCEKTEVIEEFIADFLEEDEYYLLDEYCAHTVEGRFTPHGYQDYSSYNVLVSNLSKKFSPAFLDLLIQLGNTFSKDLLLILESFIDEGLRDEITQQFKNDINFKPGYQDISLECKEVFADYEKLDILDENLIEYFEKYARGLI